MSSGPKEIKVTSLKDVKKQCPLSATPAIEGILGSMSLLSLIAITIVSLNDGTTGEAMFTRFEKILKGECQKENFSNLPAFWESLQGGLNQLSASQTRGVLNTFFVKLLIMAMKNQGAISMFKITNVFIEACGMFPTLFETDNGDGFHEDENNFRINSGEPQASSSQQKSGKKAEQKDQIDERTKRSEVNPNLDKRPVAQNLPFQRSLGASSRNSEQDTNLEKAEQCKKQDQVREKETMYTAKNYQLVHD